MGAKRLIAAAGVGGLVTLGAVASTLGAPTSASAGGQVVRVGQGSQGTVVDVLPMRDIGQVQRIDLGSGSSLRVGGAAAASDGPMSVCALCQTLDDDEALL